jgi:hypothetical protein
MAAEARSRTGPWSGRRRAFWAAMRAGGIGSSAAELYVESRSTVSRRESAAASMAASSRRYVRVDIVPALYRSSADCARCSSTVMSSSIRSALRATTARCSVRLPSVSANAVRSRVAWYVEWVRPPSAATAPPTSNVAVPNRLVRTVVARSR